MQLQGQAEGRPSPEYCRPAQGPGRSSPRPSACPGTSEGTVSTDLQPKGKASLTGTDLCAPPARTHPGFTLPQRRRLPERYAGDRAAGHSQARPALESTVSRGCCGTAPQPGRAGTLHREVGLPPAPPGNLGLDLTPSKAPPALDLPRLQPRPQDWAQVCVPAAQGPGARSSLLNSVRTVPETNAGPGAVRGLPGAAPS